MAGDDVRARAGAGAERDRLWAKVREYSGYGDQDHFARQRPHETTVVILEPRP